MVDEVIAIAVKISLFLVLNHDACIADVCARQFLFQNSFELMRRCAE